MRVLVTGASGFVGANLARRLLEGGHEVHLVLRAGHAPWRIAEIRGAVRVHDADLADAPAVERAVFLSRPEWVFHLAAHGAYSSQTDERAIFETNVAGTANLVNACVRAGFDAFVHAGSSSEYGLKDHPPAEDERCEPNSHYAVTKLAATHYVRFVARHHGLHAVTLRLYSVYGPYEEPTRLVPTILSRALSGAWPPLVDPRVARDFVHTDDVCEAFLRAAATPGQEHGAIYNVGSGVQTTLAGVVDAVRRVVPIAVEPTWGTMPNRAWDTTTWVSDPRQIERALGWRAAVPFEVGLARTADWIRADAERRRFYGVAGG